MDKHEHGAKPDWKQPEKKGHPDDKRVDHKYPDKKIEAPEVKRGPDMKDDRHK